MDTTTSSPNFSAPTASSVSSPRYRGLGVALAVTAGLWLTAVGAGIAHADTPPLVETKSQQVVFDDLNLTSESGARTLLVRINKAARAACGPSTHSPLLPREAAHQRACVTDAVDTAVRRVDLPVLTALYTGARADITIAAR
jgi:UrcA family protein